MSKKTHLVTPIDPEIMSTNLQSYQSSNLTQFNIQEEDYLDHRLGTLEPLDISDINRSSDSIQPSFSKRNCENTIRVLEDDRTDRTPTGLFETGTDLTGVDHMAYFRASVETNSTKHPFLHKEKKYSGLGQDPTYITGDSHLPQTNLVFPSDDKQQTYDDNIISNPSSLLLKNSNIEDIDLTNYPDFGNFPKFEYSKQISEKENLKNTQSLNFGKEETQSLGKLITVRNFVRKNTGDSLSGPMPTPNIPESPDSTNQLEEPSYRNHNGNLNILGEIHHSILNFDTIEQNMQIEEKKHQLEREKIQQSQMKRQELKEYIEMIKESLEEIYNEKFKNISSDYQMKESMHLKVIRELKKKADTLVREASQRSIITQKEILEQNQTHRQIDEMKSQARRKDIQISELNDKIYELENELKQNRTPKEYNPAKKNANINSVMTVKTHLHPKGGQFEELMKKVEDLEEENAMLMYRLKQSASEESVLDVTNFDQRGKNLELYLEKREDELKSKYKKLEDHLTNKFKVETGLFFENVQKEMEEILAGKGLPASKRRIIEIEFRNQLKKEYFGQNAKFENLTQNGLTPINIGIESMENDQIDTQRKNGTLNTQNFDQNSSSKEERSSKKVQANLLSFGLFANQTNAMNTSDIRDPDELEIKAIEKQIKMELQADIAQKEKNLIKKYSLKEAEMVKMDLEMKEQRNELARQKSLFNVRMTKFKKEKKELLKIKNMKQSEIEADLKQEYKNIQKEAEYLKKEVESCYEQLQSYQTGKKSIKSRPSNYKSRSKSKPKSKKSFSGLKMALPDRNVESKKLCKSKNTRSVSPEEFTKLSDNSLRRRSSSLINIQGASSHREMITSNRSIESIKDDVSKSIKTEAAMFTKDEPTFGSRNQFESKSQHNANQSRSHSRKSRGKKNANDTGKFGYNSNPNYNSKGQILSVDKNGARSSFNSKEILITDHDPQNTSATLHYQSTNQKAETTDRYSIREHSYEQYPPQLSDQHIRGYLVGQNSTNSKLGILPDSTEEELSQTERLIKMDNPGSRILEDTSDAKSYRIYDEVLQEEYSHGRLYRETTDSKYYINPSSVERTPESSYGSRVFQERDLDSFNQEHQTPEQFRDRSGRKQSNPFSTPPPNKYNSERSYIQNYSRSQYSKSKSKSKSRARQLRTEDNWRSSEKNKLCFDRRKDIQFVRHSYNPGENKENDSRVANFSQDSRPPQFHLQE